MTEEESLKDKIDRLTDIRNNLNSLIAGYEKDLQDLRWKDKPVCTHSFSEISNGKCEYGDTIRGMIYCNHPNCTK